LEQVLEFNYQSPHIPNQYHLIIFSIIDLVYLILQHTYLPLKIMFIIYIRVMFIAEQNILNQYHSDQLLSIQIHFYYLIVIIINSSIEFICLYFINYIIIFIL